MRHLYKRIVQRDGVALVLWDEGGDGFPIVFQHGLCGDVEQVRDAMPDMPGTRLICLECRGHGQSGFSFASPPTIAQFTDDVVWAVEGLKLNRFLFGGISMGAAIALRAAVLRPEMIAGLVLMRPAWAFAAAPENGWPNVFVGRLLQEFSTDAGLAVFKDSRAAQRLGERAPDNLVTMLKFFARQPQDATAELLVGIAGDGPGVSVEQAALLNLPTLVLGHGVDEVHPLALAHELAAAIPAAQFREITPKAIDKARYLADVHTALKEFVARIA